MSGNRRILSVSVLAAGLCLAAAAPAVAVGGPAKGGPAKGGPVKVAGKGAPGFSTPLQLPTYAGGEPSLATDYNPVTRHDNVYVVAPQSIPAIGNSLLAGSTGGPYGVAFWASHDGGQTFPTVGNWGSSIGGGDSDVAVDPHHRVVIADLEAAAAAICTSTNEGTTFTSGNSLGGGCKGTVSNQQGPENDRPWVNAAPDGSLYLTYHDFAAGLPIIERSTDGGASFLPCGTILSPTSQAGANYSPLNGTLVAKPALDSKGDIFVEVTEPAALSSPVSAPLGNLYLAVAKGGCTGSTVFTDHTIYTNPNANLAKIFDGVAVDGAGTIYVVTAGTLSATQKTNNIYLFTSRDGGATWTPPQQVNSSALTANVMPAIVAGAQAGQVAIGWFGSTTSGSPDNSADRWRYYAATSTDAGSSFAQSPVTSGIIHYGDICTVGVLCGTPADSGGGNRNLADFSSIALDPLTGCAIVAFPGDPYNQGAHNTGSSSAYVARQTSGTCFAPTASALAGTKGKSKRSGSAVTTRAASATSSGTAGTQAARPATTADATAADATAVRTASRSGVLAAARTSAAEAAASPTGAPGSTLAFTGSSAVVPLLALGLLAAAALLGRRKLGRRG